MLRKCSPDYDYHAGIGLGIDGPGSVEHIIAELNILPEEVISVMINVYPAKLNRIVNDGDFITLAKEFGGG